MHEGPTENRLGELGSLYKYYYYYYYYYTVNQIVPSQLQIIHVVRLFQVIKIHVIMLMCKEHF